MKNFDIPFLARRAAIWADEHPEVYVATIRIDDERGATVTVYGDAAPLSEDQQLAPVLDAVVTPWTYDRDYVSEATGKRRWWFRAEVERGLVVQLATDVDLRRLDGAPTTLSSLLGELVKKWEVAS